jgi:hypothetical protein
MYSQQNRDRSEWRYTDVAPTKAIIAELALDVLRVRVHESMLRTWIGQQTEAWKEGK